MRLSYPLGLQPHQGIFAASRQTPLPPSLRSALPGMPLASRANAPPEGKVKWMRSSTINQWFLNSTTNAFAIESGARSESHDASRPLRLEQPRVLSSPPPPVGSGAAGAGQRTQRGAYSEARRGNILSSTPFADESGARSESHGACRPLRLEQPPASNNHAYFPLRLPVSSGAAGAGQRTQRGTYSEARRNNIISSSFLADESFRAE